MDIGSDREDIGSHREALDSALAEHACLSGERAVGKIGGHLCGDNLEMFLSDRECVRHFTYIKFTDEGLDSHQFANPVVIDGEDGKICELRIHPKFEERPEAVPYLVAYMAAAINYGSVVTPEVCEIHGAALTGLAREEFFKKICQLADA